MHLIYALPFYALSIILIIIFRYELTQLGQIEVRLWHLLYAGLIGLGCGIVSLLLGILIDQIIQRR